jgi:predicted RNA binding protein YcfA (HicA-like mRNA interferase family)
LNKNKLLQRIIASNKNIAFKDFVLLVEAYGFLLARVEGSHHIFKNERLAEIINLQNVNGEAKPYQIKQFLSLVEQYGLEMEE